MDLTAAPRSEPASSSARLWFAFLGGMVAYALHLLVGFWIVPAACGTGAEGLIPWLEGAATVVLAAVAVGATVVAVGARRSLADDRRHERREAAAGGTETSAAWDATPGSSPGHFMATAGVCLNAIAVAVILFAALPLVLVSPCA